MSAADPLTTAMNALCAEANRNAPSNGEPQTLPLDWELETRAVLVALGANEPSDEGDAA